jgi:hypothetical protein
MTLFHMNNYCFMTIWFNCMCYVYMCTLSYCAKVFLNMIATKQWKHMADQLRTQTQIPNCLVSNSNSTTLCNFRQLLSLSVPHS